MIWLAATVTIMLGLMGAIADAPAQQNAAPAQAASQQAAAPDTAPLPTRLPPREDRMAAKQLFGHTKSPAPLKAEAIGFYSRGCLAGGVAMPVDGETWQAMRLSRNRNWGHPVLVGVLKRLAEDVAAKDGWQGLLIGDLSQPRGGPMLTGHRSHQIGLDADVWLTPMPSRRLSVKEREQLSATSMLMKNGYQADPKIFTPYHAALIRRAASYDEVERVLVHPGIKKAMCEEAGVDRSHFFKIRPYWGHHYHMHIRLACPKGSTDCRGQRPPARSDGCGKEVDDWIELLRAPPKEPKVTSKPRKPRGPILLGDLPPACREVITAKPRSPLLTRSEK